MVNAKVASNMTGKTTQVSGGLRLGVDGRCFLGTQAGTARYAKEICLALHRAFPKAEVLIYGPKSMQLPREGAGWVVRSDSSGFWGKMPGIFWYMFRAGRLARQDGINVFWGAANFLPFGLGSGCLSLLTVYDLVPDLYPKTMRWTHRLAHRLFFRSGLRHSDVLITISAGTRERVSARYGRLAELVIRPCTSAHFTRPDEATIARVRKAHDLPDKYLLTVATFEPRKNLAALLEAYVGLARQGIDFGALVLVGEMGWLTGPTVQAIETAQRQGLVVRCLGYVPDEDLPALYACAELFVLPSLYEGFGIPVMEALSCGARTLASDVPEIREAGGTEATYCEPTVEGLATGILRALSQPKPAVQPASESTTDDPTTANPWSIEAAALIDTLRARL
jgi:glycosyltransferase involved in cell wall biosynthesis